MPRDYYEVLGVSRNAPDKEIRSAYRKLARQYHPDRNPGDKEAEAKFKEVQHAYDVLSDSQKRAQYDQFGPGFEDAATGARPGGGRSHTFRWGGPGGAQEFDFGDAQSIFEQFFSGGAGAGARPGARGRPWTGGQDVEQEIEVDFMTAAKGGSVELAAQYAVGPSGQKRLKLDIPAGVADGARLRLRGQGPEGGDLYVKMRIRPHPYFRREGQDILLDVPISIEEAILGAKIDVPTLDGTVTLTIPPGSSSGQRLRIRKRGLPKPGGGERGDQYVELKIVVPRSADERSRELIEAFSQRNPFNPREGVRWS